MKHIILEKAEVQPFSRVRRGKLERVKGWLMPEKYGKTYTPTTRGVMDFINDHIGIKGYTDILQRCAKESTYIMEGVQSAFIDVTNKGRGTFEKMAKKNPEGLKPFLAAVFTHVQDDIVALRTDLRKSRTVGAKDKKSRKKRGMIKVRNPNPKGEPFIWVKPVKAEVVEGYVPTGTREHLD
jgi:hypothetical protein